MVTKTDWTVMVLMRTALELRLDYSFVNRFIYTVKNMDMEISEIFDRGYELPAPWGEFVNCANGNIPKFFKCTEHFLRRKIELISTENSFYPPNLKKRLGEKTPPCFFAIGNTDLTLKQGVSVTGVRDIFHDDEVFARRIGELCTKEGLVTVSGGADGVDSAALEGALSNGGEALVYLPQGFEKSGFIRKNRRFLDSGNLLCLSLCEPAVGFIGNNALERNIYIHSHGEITVTVRAKYKSGGSWSGACYNLQRGKTPAYVIDIPSPGNEALIEMGARVLKREALLNPHFSLGMEIPELAK